MEITKTCYCTITIKDGDRISDVLVTRETDEYNKLGKIEEREILPSPTSDYKYICNTLMIQGGSASNISVRNGGRVDVISGKVKGIDVEQYGNLKIYTGEVTDIREFGGMVEFTRVRDQPEPVVKFDPTEFSPDGDYGDMTVHAGNVLNYTTIGNEAVIYVIGGKIHDVIFSGGDTFVREHGIIENCRMIYGRIIVQNTGVVKDTVFDASGEDYYRSIMLEEGVEEGCLIGCKISARVEIVSRTDNFEKCFKNCEIANGTRLVQAVFASDFMGHESVIGSRIVMKWQNYTYTDGTWHLEPEQYYPRQKFDEEFTKHIKEKRNAVRPQN